MKWCDTCECFSHRTSSAQIYRPSNLHFVEFWTNWFFYINMYACICPQLTKLTCHWAATCPDTSVLVQLWATSSLPQLCVVCVRAHRVYLSEHRTLSEEQRLPGVHQDQIKVGLPGPVGGTSLWSIQTHTQVKSHTYAYKHKMFLQPQTAYLIQL